MTMRQIIGRIIVKTDAFLRPWVFRREKAAVLKRYPQLKPVMAAFERHYIRVEYGAHDRSLMERVQRQISDRDEYVYGTTTWRAFLKIAAALTISSEDVFIEPGSGTGHLCFFMNQVYGIKALGVEAISNFVKTANAIKAEVSGVAPELDFSKLHFYNLDFFTSDFSQGSIFYIAGTCFPLDYRDRLVEKIHRESKPQTRLITLTHALEHPGFEQIAQVEAFFSWGRDKALIYQKIPIKASSERL